MAENFDMTSIVMPVDVDKLKDLLGEIGYQEEKTSFLIKGFTYGFDLGYQGPQNRTQYSNNLKLRVGSEVELWNKVIQEVKAGRFCGPFDQPPFEHFVQSPIGLVPKHELGQMRLIFHLSHPKGESINCFTPKDLCSVKYNSFDKAIKMCLEAGQGCFTAKSDLHSAFRQLPIAPKDYRWLVMKAKNPLTQKWQYFFDKALPFGSSRSCALFAAFSDALAAIFEAKARALFGRSSIETDSYLDDFFFADLLINLCNEQVELFLQLCNLINFPVSMDKTVWATQIIIFLGIIINTITQTVSIPQEKVDKAVALMDNILRSKKVLVSELQRITGMLNFFCRAIVPGRTFTRRLYYQE